MKRYCGVASPFACQALCAGTDRCTHFAWGSDDVNKAVPMCWLKASTSDSDEMSTFEESGKFRISGPRSCPHVDQRCAYPGAYSMKAGTSFVPEPSDEDAAGDKCRALGDSGQWYPPSGCEIFDDNGQQHSVIRGTVGVPCRAFPNQGECILSTIH